MSHYKVTWAGFLITFAGAVLFSTKAVIVKAAFTQSSVDAITLLTLRMAFSLPFYVVIAWMESSRKEAVPITRRQWIYILFLGLFGYYLSSLFDFVGLQYVSAGLERLILFLYPTFAVLLNRFVFRQAVTRLQVIALALTYTGIAIAFAGEMELDAASPGFIKGSLLIVLCALTFATYIVGSGRVIPGVGAQRFTAYAMLSSTLGVFIHFSIAGQWDALRSSGDNWWFGILLAIVATVIPTFLLASGLKRIGSNNVAVISAIGPVSTIIQAHIVLGEPIFREQVIGTILVIIGVLLIGWKTRKKRE